MVSLQEDALLSWAKDNRVQLTEPLARDTQVFELISAHIAEVNRDLASYETVKRIGIVPEDFTVENGFLTPTFKVKRKLVTEHYAELIEQVYRAARERHVR